jgi:hypothetical protein
VALEQQVKGLEVVNKQLQTELVLEVVVLELRVETPQALVLAQEGLGFLPL